MDNQDIPSRIAVLPLRDMVVFPSVIAPLFVGRPRSVKALEKTVNGNKKILLLTQKEAARDDPGAQDLHQTGTLASVLQLLKLPDGTMKVLVEGHQRVRVVKIEVVENCFEAEIEPLQEKQADEESLTRLARAVLSRFENYAGLKKRIAPEVIASVEQIKDASKLADTIAGHISAPLADKQKLLEEMNPIKRLEKVYSLMEHEIGVLNLEKQIRRRVKRQMEKTQREYYLNEQMKAIQRELGDGESSRDEAGELEKKIKKTRFPKEVRTRAEGELRKLRQMSPMSAEATVVRNYLDWLLAVPWGKKKSVKIDLVKAKKVLDDDHYGLEKVKDRILEYLAVQKRAGKLKGPILCLVGPPGVGKTSLGRSVARATGREFARMSLGGVRDEAEIRGHRRTYIGSLPGRVIQSMKKMNYINPLFLLDEVDKMGVDFRGDPSAALLEVLDPEQNNAFCDHYMEVDYDLSEVMFITTANTLNIPPPLLDRMEVLRIPGYTEDEKLEITRRHLIPKTLKSHALKEKEWSITDKALFTLIRTYTREAGVRNLEREINALARKAVKELLTTDKIKSVAIDEKKLEAYLGPPKFRHEQIEEEDKVGVATGMAWTEFGGELLTIEGVISQGKGKMTVTGNLRDVMKESITAAQAYVRSRAPSFGIEPPMFAQKDIHVHVPEAATPKDGPSAGVAMITAIVSLMTGIPVRRDLSMTGEITLRGRILPIGGLKEKMLAALRGGVKTVLIPKDNVRDLAEIPDKVKNKLEIVPVETADDVIKYALTKAPKPIIWEEKERTQPLAKGSGNEGSGAVAH